MDAITCDGERISHTVREPRDAAVAVTVVLLHGAGTSSSERLLPLLGEFTGRGCRALALDFSGHGESSGALRELSLERRFVQGRAVIDRVVPEGDELVLVGFSMSGQTVADLVGHYGRRVRAIGLCAPAVYAEEAWRVPFGDGRGAFTGIIRRPESWRTSRALEAFAAYEGTAVLVVPGTDHVIPPAVTEAVEEALTVRSRYRRLDLERADHHLARWLRYEADDRRRFVDAVLAEPRTFDWVAKQLPDGERVRSVHRLRGGGTSQMRLLRTETERDLVLRSFVKPFYRRHAPGLLTREAEVLGLLAGTDVPAAECVAVDATAEFCDAPSLLMTRLPGEVRVDEVDLDARVELLARQLMGVHGVTVPQGARPRPYQAWTAPERVRLPEGTARPELWGRAMEVIGREAPAYEGCFLHRGFHPGNVLFTGAGEGLRLSGVVDWVETSWGPADLDVAHCSTALVLLYGVECGLRFAERYAAHGGVLSGDPRARLYWRLLDALAFAPYADKVARPWRELGRTDLTPQVLAARLEAYIGALFGGAGV
ncbi:alpha/beta fold hydrolase [Streptomyces sp. CB03238]|uniref:alpha/beta fold hydrolase n=1 Tax=Streptomyces sp. CB03238 TaxID=1907777 RepID=UPI000A0FA076|nr:alpha/beta fold hydrolase [Streptomyces sp. CB03238]ORT60344.1 aminoglycoside phosphotransferase [Streptomyces sp. CB03238]